MTKSQSLRLEIIQYDHGIMTTQPRSLLKDKTIPLECRSCHFIHFKLFWILPRRQLGLLVVGHGPWIWSLDSLVSGEPWREKDQRGQVSESTCDLTDCLTTLQKSVSVSPQTRWSFWCWIRANCWKTGVWWINFRLICMCIQCVILKIKNNINKHLGWLLFALVLTNTVLHLTLKFVALHINGLLLCLWKFSFNLSLSHTPSPHLPFSLLTCLLAQSLKLRRLV